MIGVRAMRYGATGAVVGLLGAAYGVGGRAVASSTAVDTEAPQRLIETGLYADGRIDAIAEGVRPFAPQYPLWSDGAVKRRWVYLPAGSPIDARDMDKWRFPVGTKLWKEFSVGGRKVETRFLWKASETRWVAAAYVWNEEGTDAVLAPAEGVPGIVEVAAGRRHSIPARTDCAACHSTDFKPLGFNALQLSPDRDPGAIHAEPLKAEMVTLRTLVDEGLIAPASADVLAHPPRIAASDPATRSVLGYLASNCGVCHDGTDTISARVPSLSYSDLVRDGDAIARALVGQPTKWQAPGRPDGSTVAVDPGSPETSAIVLRMKSRRPSSQMPPLGSVVQDREAVDAVSAWVAALPRRQ